MKTFTPRGPWLHEKQPHTPYNQNVILQAAQSLTATSNVSTAFLSHHQRATGLNNVGYLSGDVRHGKFSAQGCPHKSSGILRDVINRF